MDGIEMKKGEVIISVIENFLADCGKSKYKPGNNEQSSRRNDCKVLEHCERESGV
jgi:hypothetical protein